MLLDRGESHSGDSPPAVALVARAWIDGRGIRTLPLHAERNRRCRQNRERARPSHDRGVPRLVGPQRRRERGERAAARRARDRALRLPRRQRAVRRDRDRARGSRGPRPSPARPAPQRLPPPADAGRAPLADHRARGIGRDALLAAPRRHRRAARVNDNEIRQILRDSDDVAERRAAWEASKTVGAAVADDVRELARLRNAAAHSLGYRDWFALSVATSEMDEDKLMATLDDADRATAEPFARWKAELDERLAARFGLRRRRARAVALRRRVLPGGPGRGRRRPRHVPRGRRSGRDQPGAPTTASGSRRAP